MKAYRITVIVCDFEGYGVEECRRIVSSNRYVNVVPVKTETLEIGEWSDDHPLNQLDGAGEWFEKMATGKVDG